MHTNGNKFDIKWIIQNVKTYKTVLFSSIINYRISEEDQIHLISDKYIYIFLS